MSVFVRTFDLLHADLVRVRAVFGLPTCSRTKLWLGLASPRVLPVLLIRLASLAVELGWRPIGRLISGVNYSLFGVEVALNCQIGPGLYLPHTQGTVIGAVEIGRNASIYQGVTLGARDFDPTFSSSHRPTLGDDVTIGAGAVVLGGVRISDGAVVGANAVVLADVPIGCLAVGVPARVIERGRDGSGWR